MVPTEVLIQDADPLGLPDILTGAHIVGTAQHIFPSPCERRLAQTELGLRSNSVIQQPPKYLLRRPKYILEGNLCCGVYLKASGISQQLITGHTTLLTVSLTGLVLG